MKRPRSIALAVVALAGLCACGSSPHNSAAPPAAASSAGGGAQATGSPIKLVTIAAVGQATIGASIQNGVQAAEKAINKDGGVNGHPLQVSLCNDMNDSNVAAECARNAVGDPNVVAIVADGSLSGTTVDPIFAGAKLASIGDGGQGGFESPVLFPLSAGGLSDSGGAAAVLASDGAKRISLAYQDVPGAAALVSLTNLGLASFHLTLSRSVAIPPTAADLSPQVAELIRGNPDGIVLVVTTDLAVKVIQLARQLGYTNPIAISSAALTGADVQSLLGGNASNLKFIGRYARAGSGYAQFKSDMSAAGYPTSDLNDDTLNAWLAVRTFADVAKPLSDVTRASVWAAISNLSSYNTNGLTPTIDFAQPPTAGGASFSRLFNPTSVELRYENGTLVDASAQPKFVNIFTGQSEP
jgi:branched-chain amino acid transport system substrate-binding protein